MRLKLPKLLKSGINIFSLIILMTLYLILQSNLTYSICCGNVCYEGGICRNEKWQQGCQSDTGQVYANNDLLGSCLACTCSIDERECNWVQDNSLCSGSTLDTCGVTFTNDLVPVTSQCVDRDDHLNLCSNNICSKFEFIKSGELNQDFDPIKWGYSFGDVNTAECCGDDKDETVNSRKANQVIFNPDPTDKSCCDRDTDCVFNGICYSNGQTETLKNQARIFPNVYCDNSFWTDCDRNSETCKNCNFEFLQNKCCGDDPKEYIQFRRCTGPLGGSQCFDDPNDKACCTDSTQCVDKGQCFSTGTSRDIDLDNDIEICADGSWHDQDLSKDLCQSDFKGNCCGDDLKNDYGTTSLIDGIDYLCTNDPANTWLPAVDAGKIISITEKNIEVVSDGIKWHTCINPPPATNSFSNAAIVVDNILGVHEFICYKSEGDNPINTIAECIGDSAQAYSSVAGARFKNGEFLKIDTTLNFCCEFGNWETDFNAPGCKKDTTCKLGDGCVLGCVPADPDCNPECAKDGKCKQDGCLEPDPDCNGKCKKDDICIAECFNPRDPDCPACEIAGDGCQLGCLNDPDCPGCGQFNRAPGGELEAFGSYNPGIELGGCCGDDFLLNDKKEFFIQNNNQVACCNTPTDCVWAREDIENGRPMCYEQDKERISDSKENQDCFDGNDNDCDGGKDFGSNLPKLDSVSDFENEFHDPDCTIFIGGQVKDGLDNLGLEEAEIFITGKFIKPYLGKNPVFRYSDFTDANGEFNIEVNGASVYDITISPTSEADFEPMVISRTVLYDSLDLGEIILSEKHDSCKSDCTNIGNNLCNKECDSQFGSTPHKNCFFSSNERNSLTDEGVKKAMAICHERRKGNILTSEDQIIKCCEGNFETQSKVKATIDTDCDDITTRRIVTLNGKPVILVIHSFSC